MKCKDCKYFHSVYEDEVRCSGECHKNAPRTIIGGCGVGEFPQYARDWADVDGDELCGEFDLKGV